MVRSRATPVFIDDGNVRYDLERIYLGNGLYNESWLQALIHDHPRILPISDIEPGFGDLIAVAREVPCGHGFIDNLFITPSGSIVLVETKLWRNTQMRREVVAQTLDYVAALSTMAFDTFETAVAKGQSAPSKLYDLVRDHPEALNEAEFTDAVALNLRRGRMIAIALGDGIRAETELLSDLLQSHAGAHFTFALVEIATWRSPTQGILAIPNTLAKTVMIERGTVRIEDGIPNIYPVPKTEQVGPQTLTSTDFWEAITLRNPTLPTAIRDLLTALEPYGVYPDIKASLNLKVDLADEVKPLNLGYIMKNGQFWTNPAAWSTPEYAWRPYFEKLADLVDGIVVSGSENYVSTNGKSAPRIEQFLPHYQDEFVAAIGTMLRALSTHQS